MKLLNGAELAGYIKERHARQVKDLRLVNIQPKLAIVQVKDDPVINTYVRLKQNYAADVGVDLEVYKPRQKDVPQLLNSSTGGGKGKLGLNNDPLIHGIIIQLPLENPLETEKIVNLVAPEKDVDGLGKNAKFEPAAPTAILWLLSGYNIELASKRVLLIGRGKLVGAPLEKILKASNINVETVEKGVANLAHHTKQADIIITATGSPGILRSDMIKPKTVVVDAGVASEHGKTIGDLAPDVYERKDLIITPQKGGVGPLTVCVLFENVIRAASNAKN